MEGRVVDDVAIQHKVWEKLAAKALVRALVSFGGGKTEASKMELQTGKTGKTGKMGKMGRTSRTGRTGQTGRPQTQETPTQANDTQRRGVDAMWISQVGGDFMISSAWTARRSNSAEAHSDLQVDVTQCARSTAQSVAMHALRSHSSDRAPLQTRHARTLFQCQAIYRPYAECPVEVLFHSLVEQLKLPQIEQAQRSVFSP